MTANFRSKNIAEPRVRRVHQLRRVPQVLGAVALTVVIGSPLSAQGQVPTASAQSVPATAAAVAAPRPTDPVVPPGYIIGTDDVLSIVYWKDKDMSADAKVRP